MRSLSHLIISSGMLVVGAAAATAEVCVSCTGPAATYACSVKNGEAIEGLAGDKALRKICRKVLKRTEHHASCQAVVVPDGTCAGTARTVSWGDVKKAVTAREAGPKAAVADPPTELADGATKPPSSKSVAAATPTGTVAAKPAEQPSAPAQSEPAAPQGLGDKIKHAAQSTWTCMTSLFGNC